MRGKTIKFSAFVADDSRYLPHYVFSYYSGESPRMHEVFRPYLETYDSKLRNGEDPGLKRLFYAMPVHSQFVLLAFLIQQSDVVRRFSMTTWALIRMRVLSRCCSYCGNRRGSPRLTMATLASGMHAVWCVISCHASMT